MRSGETTVRALRLPDSVPNTEDGLAAAPSAARNTAPILAALRPRLPRRGRLVELASGMGQHAAALAAAHPGLRIEPTEPDEARRAIIDARCFSFPNVAPARGLDACAPGWGAAMRADAVLTVNLLHLISDAEMAVLLDEAAQAVVPGGVLAIYGPFLRNGLPASRGDAAFDADLRRQDAAIGYKDAGAVEQVLALLGFGLERIAMPANNLMLVGRRTAPAL